MTWINTGIIGMGFIGSAHIDALRRIGFVDVTAVADVNYELAKNKAGEYRIPKCFNSVDRLLADPEIQVIHNCTPNNLHKEINEKIIKAGKHVFSEKPLATSSNESAAMLKLLDKNPGIVHGVNFCYRMNPLVQEMKYKVKNGELGSVRLVHGSFLQDWLLFETDYNWRVEAEISGPSRCIADIGSHWMDTVQVIVGAKITAVCADLLTVIPVRKKQKGKTKTFSVNENMEYEEQEVKTEDWGAVLIRFDNGAHGVFYASQVSAGRKCRLDFEIDGSKSSMYWNQETPDQMWEGFRQRQNSIAMRNPMMMSPEAQKYTYLPAGHPEGWNDAMRNNFYSFYTYIRDSKSMGKDACDFATFEDGHYLTKLTEAILNSNQTGRWVVL